MATAKPPPLALDLDALAPHCHTALRTPAWPCLPLTPKPATPKPPPKKPL